MPGQGQMNKKAYRKPRRKTYIPRKNLNKYQVKAVAQKVAKKLLNREIETKHLYDGQGATAITTLGDAYQLTVMTTGTEHNDIIGVKCRVTSLWINYSLTVETGGQYNRVRLIVFQDKQLNTVTIPFQSQMFQDFSSRPITCMYNVDTVPSRYQILYDKVVTIDSDDPTYTGKIVIRSIPKVVHFQDDPTVTASIAQGHLYFFVVSDSLAGSVYHPQLEWSSAIFYKDA